MKDITKVLGGFLIFASLIAYWDRILGSLGDIRIGILELSSLLNMEPLQVIFLIGGIALFAYLGVKN